MLISPYGGTLVDLCAAADETARLANHARSLPSVQLSERATCDLELLATGAFSPLATFMGRRDYESVVHDMRLADGRLFPIPVTLNVAPESAPQPDAEVALRSPSNDLLGVMRVQEIYPWDRRAFLHHVLGSDDPRHPTVAESERWGELQLSGAIRMAALPRHHDFTDLRLTPHETRERLSRMGNDHVVAFQTRNPMHRGHEAMVRQAMTQASASLLLHPTVGLTPPGDVAHYTRVRSYRALVGHSYGFEPVVFSILPLAMRMAGPREAVWHALIRRNYGASHFVVGRDHASPGEDSHGRPFYAPDGAAALLESLASETGVGPVAFDEFVYLPDEDRYAERRTTGKNVRTISLSGTRLRRDYLDRGVTPPEWFVRPQVAEVLADVYPAAHRRGFAVWFTGLSGAGKSTTARVLLEMLLERGRQVTYLDGDIVRQHLSKGLGFSKADRDTNILRIGFVAAEVVRHHGVAVCAAVSPYRATRETVRQMIGADRFVEVFVDAPLSVCQARDPKGMYTQARRGDVQRLTGVDDPYEPPLEPEIVLDAVGEPAEANARRILHLLDARGWVLTAKP